MTIPDGQRQPGHEHVFTRDREEPEPEPEGEGKVVIDICECGAYRDTHTRAEIIVPLSLQERSAGVTGKNRAAS